jgi:hypothetical protein
MLHFHHTLRRQVAPDRRQEENGDVDGKTDTPQNRAKRRPIAEIGEDVSDPHDQEQYGQFVDQALRAGTKFRKQDRDGKKRKGLDAVLVRTQSARGNWIFVEGGITRPGIVEAAKPDPLYRGDAQQIKHQGGENAPFGDGHGFPDMRRSFLEGRLHRPTVSNLPLS